MEIIHKPHKLLILSQDFEDYRNLIENVGLPGLSIWASEEPDEALRIGRDCDLVFGEPSRLCKVLNYLPNLKWVQSSWAGVEPLLAATIRHDYILTNARNVYGSNMSEYVFGYLLMIERRILHRWQAQQEKKWDDSSDGTLRGKLLGLLGVGTIGAALAVTAKHFNMRVYGYTRQSETCTAVDKYFHDGDWHSFAPDLDYLVNTLPGTVYTKDMLDDSHLLALPQKAWIVNVGRGSTVDESALVNALRSGSISGAVLDVFAEEPLPPGHPLWSTPNTFITAHTAARNYLPDIAELFNENYKLLIQGKPLLYQVDFDQGY